MKTEEYAIQVPKLSDWLCYWTPDIIYRPPIGGQPNRFHRFMQALCFGYRWVLSPQ